MSESCYEHVFEKIRKMREERKAQGVCIWCGGLIEDVQYVSCLKCREKKREANARYRENRENMKQLHVECVPLEAEQKVISEDHKCWTCEWSRFEGDRFFCLFAYGTCVKEGNVCD